MRGWVSFEVVPTPQRPCHEPRYKRGSEWYEVGIFALKAGEAVVTTVCAPNIAFAIKVPLPKL